MLGRSRRGHPESERAHALYDRGTWFHDLYVASDGTAHFGMNLNRIDAA